MNKNEIVCYETDASQLVGKAEKVVFPKNADDVQKIVKESFELDIVPRGGGSNLVGGCVPQNSIVMDMRKMNKVLDFNSKTRTVCAEAGVVIKELNEKLKKFGFEFPIYSSNEISTIGSMVAMDSIGDRSMGYGSVKDWVEEVEFVNGRGEIVKVGRADLSDVCGREGITGIILKIKLKIIPIPLRSASIFQTNDIEEIWAIAKRLRLEKEVNMLKFLNPKVSGFFGFPEKYHLIIGFDSDRGKIKGEEYKSLFKTFKKDYYFLYSKGYYFVENVKLFFDKLKEFLLLLERADVPYFGDLGLGIVCCFFKDEYKRKEIADVISKMNGRFVQGVGIIHKSFLDALEKKIIQRIKLRHDPFWKINKGKVIDIDSFSGAGSFKSVEKNRFEVKEKFGKIENSKLAEEKRDEKENPEKEIESFISEVKRGEGKEIKEKLLDYERTFKSELGSCQRERVEIFAKQVPQKIVESSKDVKHEPVNKDFINNIMTNRFSDFKDVGKAGEIKKDIVNDSINKPLEGSRGKVSESERSLIDSVMMNKFGIGKKENKNDS